jgi:WD40 repeat protein
MIPSPRVVLLASLLLSASPSVAQEPKAVEARRLATVSAHSQGVIGVAVSPDGSCFVSWTYDKTVKVWSLPEGKLLKSLDLKESVSHAAISPDSKTLFTSDFLREELRQWSLPDGKPLELLTSTLSGPRLALTADGKYLVASSGKIELWALPEGKFLRVLKDHADSRSAPAISRDGKLLAVGTGDSQVKVWSLPDGQLLHALAGHDVARHITGSGVQAVAFSPEGKVLASGGSDKRVMLWSVSDGKRLHDLKEHEDWVLALAFSQDGKILASASADNTVKLWSVPEGKLLHTLPGYRGQAYDGGGPYVALAFTPDDRILPVVGRDVITLWSVRDGKRLTRLEGHKNSITVTQLTRDGKYLVSGDSSGSIIVWELPSARPGK